MFFLAVEGIASCAHTADQLLHLVVQVLTFYQFLWEDIFFISALQPKEGHIGDDHSYNLENIK